jgi:Domain of unknown function (DUF4386)
MTATEPDQAANGGGLTREDQLAWEEKWSRPVAAAAALALLAFFVGGALVASSRGSADDTGELLREFNSHEGGLIASGIVSFAGLLLQIVPMGYLYAAAKFRRHETPSFAIVLTVAGALVTGVLGIIVQLESISVAQDFVDGNPPSNAEAADNLADDMIEDSALPTLELVRLGAGLGFGLGLLVIAMYAMRAGILSRFMGILGIIIGVLYAIPILGGPQFLLVFWLGALIFLLLDRWPGGRGPAWESATAQPWPSGAEMRARMAEQREAARDEPEAADPDTPQGAPRKRKRKKRR